MDPLPPMARAEVLLRVDATSLLAPEGLSPVRRIVRTHSSPPEKGASVGKKTRRACPAAHRARRRFDKRRRKCRLSFDELHRRLMGSGSLEAIAKDAGISGPRLTYLYNSLFAPTLGLPSPRRRAKDILAKRRALALAGPFRDQSLERVRRRLEGRGHSVESTFCDENGGTPRRRHKRRLKVDGKLCSWHRMFNSTRGRKSTSPRYSRTTMGRLTLEKTTFVLLEVAPPRCKPMILKVPSKALRREYFSGTSHHRVHIYVPLDRIPDNPRFPFLDYIV
jgi:hypothetical protein